MSNKPPSHHFTMSLRTLTPFLRLRLQRQAHTHKASRTTTVIDIRVVSCNLHVLQITDNKQQKRLPHARSAHPTVATWQFALVVAFQQVASLSKDTTLQVLLFFFFLKFCSSENYHQRVVGSSGVLPERCCFFSSQFAWCILPPVLWVRCYARLFCWVVLPSLSCLRSRCFSPLRACGWCFFFQEPAPPRRGGRR